MTRIWMVQIRVMSRRAWSVVVLFGKRQRQLRAADDADDADLEGADSAAVATRVVSFPFDEQQQQRRQLETTNALLGAIRVIRVIRVIRGPPFSRRRPAPSQSVLEFYFSVA